MSDKLMCGCSEEEVENMDYSIFKEAVDILRKEIFEAYDKAGQQIIKLGFNIAHQAEAEGCSNELDLYLRIQLTRNLN